MNNTAFLSLKRDLFVVGILAVLSLCLGLLLNQFRAQSLPLVYQSKEVRLEHAVAEVATKPVTPFVASDALSKKLSLEQFRALVEERHIIILDARPEIFYRLGHVPGALSLPREDFEKSYQGLKTILEADKSQPLAVYCSSDSCEDSKLVQKALVALGYRQVMLFEGGWDDWTGAGLPEEKSGP